MLPTADINMKHIWIQHFFICHINWAMFCSNQAPVVAMVTGWMSPQHEQIWYPTVWWAHSPKGLNVWHTESSHPPSWNWRHTQAVRINTSIQTTHLCAVMYLQDAWDVAPLARLSVAQHFVFMHLPLIEPRAAFPWSRTTQTYKHTRMQWQA